MSSGYAGQPMPPSRASGGSRQMTGGTGTTNLADLLERVLDKGIVIAGDITVSLGQVELLSIKLRLIVASIDKAQEIGIDWWRSDPALSSHAKQMETQNEDLKSRLDRLEDRLRSLPMPQAASGDGVQAPQQSGQSATQAQSANSQSGPNR